MRNNITDIDKNFKVEETIKKDGMCFFDIESSPFKIYGIYKDNGIYRRMPEDVAKKVSGGVYALHTNTSGGRIRFVTDSSRISLIVKFGEVGRMTHFALTGSAGFDLYVREDGKYNYHNTYRPMYDITDSLEGDLFFSDSRLRDITINFPLYSSVKNVMIGIAEGSILQASPEYKYSKPIVFYGSSITQGACASRPGNTYQAMISRRFDCDFINLGFSGSALAEQEIADYIKSLDMSVFVYDYDYNAPDTEYLKNTHEKMFKSIRENNPEIPIIIMSKPHFILDDNDKECIKIIKATYENAISNGDKNVYFVDGPTLMELAENDGTVDNCHPNDLGFYSMSLALGKILENIL